MSTIRVALADDNVLLREGVSRLVSAHPDFELVGTASDLPELLTVIESSEPDVVITDIRMPPTGRDEGIQAAAWLREHRPEVPRDLETICLKAMAKRPEDRYTDCQELADDLRRWIEGDPIAARRMGVRERMGSGTRP